MRVALSLWLAAFAALAVAACLDRAPCATHADCEAGVCLGSRCEAQVTCNADAECPGGARCVDGLCAGAPAADDDDAGTARLDGGGALDAGAPLDDGGAAPADGGGPLDAGGTLDAGGALDAGPARADGGAALDDGGAAPDAGALDAGPLDAGPLDAGPVDAGPLDAGAIDAGPIDAGAYDADAGPIGDGDAGTIGDDDAGVCVDEDVLFDDFSSGSVDTPPWEFVVQGASFIDVVEGRLRISYDAATPGGYATAGMISGDMRDRRVTIRVVEVPDVMSGASAILQITDADSADRLQVVIEHGEITALIVTGGSSLAFGLRPYTPDVRFIRVAESAGVVDVTASIDGVVFTPFASLETPGWYDATWTALQGGTYQVEASTGRALLDDVEFGPTLGRDCP